MKPALDRLLFEAGAAAANSKSAAHRISAAREVSQFDLDDLTSVGEGRGHLALAIREAVISLALVGDADARTATAEAIRALVRAARTEPRRRDVEPSEPRRYWVDQ
jgi:hypothetical protein